MFQNFFVNSPNCTANRASLLTCRPLWLHGASLGKPLSLDQKTFVGELRGHGYVTKLIGKAHFQGQSSKAPSHVVETEDAAPLFPGRYEQENMSLWRDKKNHLDLPYYGFDDVDLIVGHGDIAEGNKYTEWIEAKYGDHVSSLRGQGKEIMQTPHVYRSALPIEAHPTTYIAEKAIEFFNQHDQKDPFFLMVSFPDPHHVRAFN